MIKTSITDRCFGRDKLHRSMENSCGDTSDPNYTTFFNKLITFPTITDGKINVESFLEAASSLVAVIERLGKLFAPVRYDIQGNVDKIKKYYQFNKDSCLLELMSKEISTGKPIAAEGVLWLNRTLLFFEIVFQEILKCLQSDNIDGNMKEIFILAYKGSVKQYHSWVTQQLFFVICKMSPTLPEIMTALEVKDVKSFKTQLAFFNTHLHHNRCEIDQFFRNHDISKLV